MCISVLHAHACTQLCIRILVSNDTLQSRIHIYSTISCAQWIIQENIEFQLLRVLWFLIKSSLKSLILRDGRVNVYSEQNQNIIHAIVLHADGVWWVQKVQVYDMCGQRCMFTQNTSVCAYLFYTRMHALSCVYVFQYLMTLYNLEYTSTRRSRAHSG